MQSKFITTIDARGSQGSIFAVLGTACCLLKQMKVPARDIESLRKSVFESASCEEALDRIRAYFPVRLK